MYNDARMLAAQVISERLGHREAIEVAQNLIVKDDAAFSSGVLAKPSDYIFPKSLMDVNGKVISILPANQIPNTQSKDSAANPIVYEEATQFKSQHGASYIPDASTYVLRYVGITPFTVAQVVAGTVTETFTNFYEPVIIQIAVAIAMSQGLVEPLALAQRLIQIGGGSAAQS
jgi:hypothetical protein